MEYPKAPFESWNQSAYEAGFDLGRNHAGTGSVTDFSDARCLPLEKERDEAIAALSFQIDRAAFSGGYEDGYGSLVTEVFSWV